MAISFPENPTSGDIYTVNGRSWQWDGSTWGSYGTFADPASFKVDTVNDRVGVNLGSATPSYTLDVSGDARVSNDFIVGGDLTVSGTTVTLDSQNLLVEDNIITLNSNVTGTPSLDAGIEVERGDETNAQLLWDESAGAWVVNSDFTVDTNTLHVDSVNNRVGIGTTTPSYSVQVADASTFSIDVSDATYVNIGNLNSSPDTLQVASFGSIDFVIDSNNTTTGKAFQWIHDGDKGTGSILMTLTEDGHVGIGTTAPEKPLHVVIGSKSGGSYGSTHYFLVDSDGDSGLGVYSGESSEGYIRFGDATNGAAGGFRYDHSVDELYIRSGGSDRMTFDSSGNIGINTAPSTNILSINGTANPGTNGDVYIGSSGIPLNLYSTTTSSSASGWKFYSNVTGTETLQALVRANGDFESRTNTYGATSDMAIKQDIVDATSQWEDIKAVKLRKYRLIDDVAQNGDNALVQLGVIAQELEAAGLGGLVVDGDASDPDKPYKSVKYSVLLLKALGALQEAMARIEALEGN